uniref:Uncharacterized protein n=1 Tax=Arundo donax TaxID=35708 RepID=A0A0A9FXU9_ARUDO
MKKNEKRRSRTQVLTIVFNLMIENDLNK